MRICETCYEDLRKKVRIVENEMRELYNDSSDNRYKGNIYIDNVASMLTEQNIIALTDLDYIISLIDYKLPEKKVRTELLNGLWTDESLDKIIKRIEPRKIDIKSEMEKKIADIKNEIKILKEMEVVYNKTLAARNKIFKDPANKICSIATAKNIIKQMNIELELTDDVIDYFHKRFPLLNKNNIRYEVRYRIYIGKSFEDIMNYFKYEAIKIMKRDKFNTSYLQDPVFINQLEKVIDSKDENDLNRYHSFCSAISLPLSEEDITKLISYGCSNSISATLKQMKIMIDDSKKKKYKINFDDPIFIHFFETAVISKKPKDTEYLCEWCFRAEIPLEKEEILKLIDEATEIGTTAALKKMKHMTQNKKFCCIL